MAAIIAGAVFEGRKKCYEIAGDLNGRGNGRVPEKRCFFPFAPIGFTEFHGSSMSVLHPNGRGPQLFSHVNQSFIIVVKLFACLFGPVTIYAGYLKVASMVTGVDHSSGGWQIVRYHRPLLAAGILWAGIVILLNSRRKD